MHARMKTWLDRWRHLSDEDLVRCMDRERRPHAEMRLSRHLDRCRRCRLELARMEGALRDYGMLRGAGIAPAIQEAGGRRGYGRWAAPLPQSSSVCTIRVRRLRTIPRPPLRAASDPTPSLSASVPAAQKIAQARQPAVNSDAGLIEVRFAAHRTCECLGQPLSVTRQAGRIVVVRSGERLPAPGGRGKRVARNAGRRTADSDPLSPDFRR